MHALKKYTYLKKKNENNKCQFKEKANAHWMNEWMTKNQNLKVSKH